MIISFLVISLKINRSKSKKNNLQTNGSSLSFYLTQNYYNLTHKTHGEVGELV